MARTNKYTSLNFNDIYEKKTKPTIRPNSSSSSSSNNKTIISNSRIHGHMLVLSRPTPKPISVPQPEPGPIHQQQPPNKLQSPPPDQKTRAEPESDSISLRPQGRTGSGSGSVQPIVSSSPLQSPLQKSNRFVPPHLRPGFVGREEKPVPGQGVRGRQEVVGPGPGIHQHHHNQGNRENVRPKSGGGYERMNRDSVNFMNRPRSSGARPSSSG